MAKVAFLGLGVMGFPMAGHLATAGHDVTVYNRTVAKAKKWVAQFGGHYETTPAKAVKGQDIVFACVGNDDDVREITLGAEGAFQAMHEKSIFVDHTTASAKLARELSEKAKKVDIGFIDAPVSGGQSGAEEGKLTIMCGGVQSVYEKIEKIVNVYAVSVRRLGESGSGQLCKMVNQICLIGVVQGLSEGLAFGVNAGLDMQTVLDVISKGSAGSWQMDNRGFNMLADKFDYGFAVDLIRKDLGMCIAEAKSNGSVLPSTSLIDQFLGDIQSQGGGRLDASSLIKRLPHSR
ncbi:NAD(P)-dependent oxidoreductase [Bartonella tamiae]|uniref:Oxidoreductase n=1 Tax=Bartonella tamiae Th239 TaxID=1094558 RepID=J0R143_9HYPH|nr:NAD(P)-dependent oxidoreductase [Bartonella tamiae]EJF89264.1 hypothetical protein ME5_01815 [Bartonella tamiae Th239]EJF95574.1 hypothetical protein MEG_00064 [Bartonella tamiae Th307]